MIGLAQAFQLNKGHAKIEDTKGKNEVASSSTLDAAAKKVKAAKNAIIALFGEASAQPILDGARVRTYGTM